MSEHPSLRIAMVAASPFPFPQGSQVLIAQLASALQRRGHRISLTTYHCGVGPALAAARACATGAGDQAQDGTAGIELDRLRAWPGAGLVGARPSWKKPLLDLLLARALLRRVRRWGPHLMHTHNFEGLLAALFVRRLTGVPVVHHIHNAMGLELHTYFRHRPGRWAGRLVGRWVDAHLPRRAERCIALTEPAADYFRRRGAQVSAIAPGIDWAPGDAGRARSVVGGGPLVLYSGNLDPYQDLGLLLSAFRLVAGARPQARLAFSTHSDPAELRARALEMGLGSQVVFCRADDLSSVGDWLAAADVAVCPRQACLGFPIKLLNYMAAGAAIVAAEGSAAGLRHMEDAWVVPNGDVPGLAAAILALLDDPALAHRLGDRARLAAHTEYTWDRAAAAVEQAYHQVIGGSP